LVTVITLPGQRVENAHSAKKYDYQNKPNCGKNYNGHDSLLCFTPPPGV